MADMAEAKYLRTRCGLPAIPALTLPPDPDDPAIELWSTEQAAAAMNVEPATVRQWASRRLIHPIPGDNGPRYRALDIMDAEARTRRQRRFAALVELAFAQAGTDGPLAIG